MKRVSFLLLSLSLTVAPTLVSARTVALDLYNPHKHYGDEGSSIADPTSRCTGASFQNAHKASLTQEKKDIDAAFAKAPESVAVQNAADAYEAALQTGWSAMLQPYCGFGAFGTTAALKSYNKTIADARARFLSAIKSTAGTVAIALAAPAPTAVQAPAPTPTKARVTTSLNLSGVEYGKSSANVKAFQEFLAENGFLSSSLTTGYFGSLTREAVIKFQLKKGVISSSSTPGAGLVGPKTTSAIRDAE